MQKNIHHWKWSPLRVEISIIVFHYCTKFIDFSASLVRETHLPIPIYVTNHGITPARAGTTHLPFSQNLLWQDHPRSRGNHAMSLHVTPCHIGSSPLTREPHCKYSPDFGSCGITPARAGTTEERATMTTINQDHPRSRGNHSALLHPG